MPPSIAAPFAAYSHGIELPGHARLIVTSGQLGLAADGTIPEGADAQAQICFDNIDAILADAAADASNVIRINAYVTDRVHMAGYMAARDAWLSACTVKPASTLVIVSGFTRPEFVVEVEVTAAVLV
ncbi:MAG: RidA family protein [Pseudomonadota bacterium]